MFFFLMWVIECFSLHSRASSMFMFTRICEVSKLFGVGCDMDFLPVGFFISFFSSVVLQNNGAVTAAYFVQC